ncbi:MAG: hypothetical protein AAF235_10045 [Planctomycetota bacterium]
MTKPATGPMAGAWASAPPVYLWCELLTLFGVVPGLAALFVARRLPGLEDVTAPTRYLMPLLLATFIVMLIVLLRAKTFPNRELWGWQATRPELPWGDVRERCKNISCSA